MASGCNKDTTGPVIILSEMRFCVNPGDDIRFTVEINDSDLKVVNMTAPDLDFITSIEAQEFLDSEGAIEFIFTVDPETNTGVYLIGIEAVDNNDNASTNVVELKVN